MICFVSDWRRRQSLAKQFIAGKLNLRRIDDQVERILHPGEKAQRTAPEIPPLRDDALITATRKLNEALSELARAIGEDGHGSIAEADVDGVLFDHRHKTSLLHFGVAQDRDGGHRDTEGREDRQSSVTGQKVHHAKQISSPHASAPVKRAVTTPSHLL